MSYLNGKLNTTEETLNLIHSDANATSANLDALMDEARQLELSVQELRQEVYNAKNANIQGEEQDCRRGTVCDFFFKPLTGKQVCHQHIPPFHSSFILFFSPWSLVKRQCVFIKLWFYF